jgi:hypothetical protein
VSLVGVENYIPILRVGPQDHKVATIEVTAARLEFLIECVPTHDGCRLDLEELRAKAQEVLWNQETAR